MKFRSKETVDAIQFHYSDAGLKQLEDFCGGAVTRHGKQHLPTEGPWCYIRIESPRQISVLVEGEWFVKTKKSEFLVFTDRDFKEHYEKA